MVKYGKLYRRLQIEEFIDNYINYKKLKQKIKSIENTLPQIGQKNSIRVISSNQSMKIRPTTSSSFSESQENDNYSLLLNEFKNLLNEEFQRFYKFFKSMKKHVHKLLNKHLYTQTNYISYNLQEFMEEITNIRGTMYLVKCLNEFINDNMTAIKKILKKFDKKFSAFYGNIGPNYILDNLTVQ